MIEDQLTRDERIRLECFAQAVALNQMGGSKQVVPLITQASQIEEYIREGKKP